MRHFSVENWADFANGVVPSDKLASMKQHLEKGCKECADALADWQSIRQFAGQELLNRPPEDVVRRVKLAFQTHGASDKQGVLRELAELIFDSFQEPALQGVRRSQMAARHLLYQAGVVTIDLRLEPIPNSDRISLDGQVMDSRSTGKGIQDVPVLLLYGRETLAQTQTNEFGEFQLQCEAGKSLHVSVGVTARKDVFIPLDDAIWRIPFGKNTH